MVMLEVVIMNDLVLVDMTGGISTAHKCNKSINVPIQC